MKKTIALSLTFILVFYLFYTTHRFDNPEKNISKEVENIQNMHTLGLLTSSDDYIFYMDYSSGPQLVKWYLQTNDKREILHKECCFINVVDKYIFYVNMEDDFTIYKADIDGNNDKKIYASSVSSLYVHNDILYFIDNDTSYLCSMRLDGSNLERIAKNVKIYNIFENIIYYVTYNELLHKDFIRSIDVSNTNIDNLIGEADEVQWINVVNDKIYFLSFGQGVYESNISYYKPTLIIEGNIPVNTLYLYKGNLYFKDYNIGGLTRKFNLQNHHEMKIKNEKYEYITILKDRIFYYKNDMLYISYLNGENRKKI